MTGGLNIGSLPETQRSMAQAADLNQNGTIDTEREHKIYQNMIRHAEQDDDMGLKVEKGFGGVSKSFNKGDKTGQSYAKIFGSQAGEVKSAELKANSKVTEMANQYGGVVDKAIASRPNPEKYVGKAPEYIQALEAWTDRVAAATKPNADAGSQTPIEDEKHTELPNNESIVKDTVKLGAKIAEAAARAAKANKADDSLLKVAAEVATKALQVGQSVQEFVMKHKEELAAITFGPALAPAALGAVTAFGPAALGAVTGLGATLAPAAFDSAQLALVVKFASEFYQEAIENK